MTKEEKQQILDQMADADRAYAQSIPQEEHAVPAPSGEAAPPPTVPYAATASQHKRKARIYISGRITGLKPEQYEPVFATVKKELEAAGHEVVNPVTDIPHDDPANWGLCILECLPYVATCDCIALLPGWERSHGAQMEYHFAMGHGLQPLNVRPVGKPNSRQRRKSSKKK